MQSLSGKIKKLLLAVNRKNDGKFCYLLHRKQTYSPKKNKIYNLRILSIVMKTEDWNDNFPAHRKDRRKYKRETVQAAVYSGFRDLEILLLLADILKYGNEKAFELVEENIL